MKKNGKGQVYAVSGNQPFGVDWKALEQLLNGQLPAVAGMSRRGNEGNWIENFVKDIVSRSTNQAGTQPVYLENEIFETHNDVIVRVKIPDGNEARRIKAFVGTDQVRLDGLPDGKQQFIQLPKSVYGESARAVFKKGILQIRAPKQTENERFNELRIRFIDPK